MKAVPKTATGTHHMLIIYVAVLFFATNLGDGAADANAGQHHVMCLLSAMANSPITVPAVTTDATTANQIISSLNMTTSAIDWQKLFDTNLDDDKGPELPETMKDKQYAADWRKHWPSWWKAAKHAKTNNIGLDAHELYKPIKSAEQKAAAHNRLRALATLAEVLTTEYETAKTQAEKTQKNLAETQLAAALYGGDGKNAAPGATHTRTAFTDWDTACTTEENGKSLIGDFFCLCNPDDGTTKECADGYTPAQWNTNIVDPSNTWKNLQSSCGATKFQKVTAADIRMAISNFLKALTAKTQGGSTKTYLGTSSDGQCDGTSSKLCIDYTGYFSKKAGKTYKDIPWLTALTAAAESIEGMQKQQEKASNLGGQLANLLTQANHIYSAALNGDLASTLTAKGQTVPDGTTKPAANCAQYDTNKTCVSPCKWESKGDKGICKLDESKVKEQTNTAEAGTAAGTNTEGKKCSDKKSEGECKDGCKWDGKECKDSSILVNKQFALSMVSAAFVALLF